MPSSAKTIAASTLWQLGSQITMAALSILSVKFVAVGLSIELAGYYNSAYGYLQLFGILADFGLYAVSVREMSRATQRENVLSALISLRTVILCLSLGTALLIAWIMPAWRGTPLPLGISFAAFVPFFTLLAGTLRSVFQVHYKLHYVFIAEVTQRVLSTLLLGLIILVGFRGSAHVGVFYFATLAGGIGALLLLLLSYGYARRLTRFTTHWEWDTFRSLLRPALPFGLAYVLLSLCRQFDTTMIALLRPDFDVQNAYYGFVLRMGDMAFIIPTFLLNSILPVVSEREGRRQDTGVLLGKTLVVLLVLGVIACLFSLLWPRPLIALLTTDQYLSTAARAGADTALSLLSIPMLLNGVILFAFYTFLVHGTWKRLVSILLLGAFLSLTANVFLIRQYGFVGAALTAIGTHLFLAMFLLPQAFTLTHVHLPRYAMRRLLCFCLLLGATLWFSRPLLINPLSTSVALAVMAGVLCLLLWITGIFRLLRSLPHASAAPILEMP